MERSAPLLTIIIPVYNGGEALRRCLAAVWASTFRDWELVVVDDGSTDDSAEIAHHFRAQVWHTPQRAGPAAARNLGATHAAGRYLFFLDADCELHPDSLSRAAALLSADPTLAALFGAYDDAPAAPNFISQYKNLLHHYTHQTARPDAATFWAGCGVIRRDVFQAIGGFDAARYPRPAVEDIELGYRLRAAGQRIRLAREVQVKHLKRWTVMGLLRSDIRDRALPWARLWLALGDRRPPADLNLRWSARLSVPALALMAAGLWPARRRKWARWLSAWGGLTLLALNAPLYLFFFRQKGLVFTLGAIAWHWLSYAYSGAALLWAALTPAASSDA